MYINTCIFCFCSYPNGNPEIQFVEQWFQCYNNLKIHKIVYIYSIFPLCTAQKGDNNPMYNDWMYTYKDGDKRGKEE